MVDGARDLIGKLGAFLADLTQDAPMPRVHEEIMHRLQDAADAADPQIAGVFRDRADFGPVWTAIRSGATLPAAAWDAVVLPVVACYSPPEELKANLETALHLWGGARSALSNLHRDDFSDTLSTPILAAYEALSEDSITTLSLPRQRDMPPDPVTSDPPRPPGRLRWWVVATALVTIAGLIVLLVLTQGGFTQASPQSSRDPIVANPSASSISPGPTAGANPATLAPPPMLPISPAAGKAPSPSAPRNLTATDRGPGSATLSWQAPLASGGGLAGYRVFRGTTEVGSTAGVGYLVTGLTPDTGYVFTVRAYAITGAASAASNAITVTTLALTTEPAAPIGYGIGFSVVGKNWPCTAAAKIHIYLAGRLVAEPTINSGGDFTIPIDLIYDTDEAKVPTLDGSGDIVLTRDTDWVIKVGLPDQPQCAPTGPQLLTVRFH